MKSWATWRLIIRDTAVGTAIFLAIGAFMLWPHLTPRFALTWVVVALCFSFFMALIGVLHRKARQHNDEMQRILSQYPPSTSFWRWGPPHPFTRWPRRPPGRD
jgi:hypothetical protein